MQLCNKLKSIKNPAQYRNKCVKFQNQNSYRTFCEIRQKPAQKLFSKKLTPKYKNRDPGGYQKNFIIGAIFKKIRIYFSISKISLT